MGTTPLPIDAIPHREQLRDLPFPESIAGLDRRLAAHHVEHVGQRGLVIIPIDLPLRGPFQKLRQERPRIDATGDQQCGKSVDRDAPRPGRGRIDAQAFEQRRERFEGRDRRGIRVENNRHELSL